MFNLNNSNYTFDKNTDIKFLKSVGPKRAQALYQNDINTVSDILKHYPRKYLDRTNIKKISDLIVNEKAVVVAKVISMSVKRTKKGSFFQLTLTDTKNTINGLWFHGVSWIMEKFNEGDIVALFGKIEFYQGYRIIHPEFDILDADDDPINTARIVPLYSSNNILKKAGFDTRGIRRLLLQIFNKNKNIFVDFFNISILKKEGLLELNKSIYSIHNPIDQFSIDTALYRLKFNEHFFLQLLKALNKKKNESYKGKEYKELGKYAVEIYKSLSFNLTESQIKSLRDIRSDLKLKKPMNRLIQGDVGCGKTIVAVITAAIVVGHNSQIAIMAPTEILAEQHFNSFIKHFKNYNISCELLISNINKTDKNDIYKKLENGEINIIVGTHALIQEKVKFKDLGLVIIDEQHRFGVGQRKGLLDKGNNPNVLSMTATPIPRTLAFTIHGDMDISWIDEMPQNRKSIITKLINDENIHLVYDHMKKEMDKGNYCYVVYPLIEESDKMDLKDAKSGYELLQKIFNNYKLGFMHGKLVKDKKNKLMNQFINGEIQCLISTTVIEVGIDHKMATIMAIENSERFGLTQLHQLRGRVGRSSLQSYCYLIQRKETFNSNQRLKIMEQTSDGFIISDEDLKLRGPGDFFGTRQHGYLNSGLINFSQDREIINRARKLAFKIID
ncbi:MAG: ATP-dependent DNA helicase RecG [Candidatus Marinimicrobia bacterium]|nr:ATP-dependent DNA helicase RecG [Candidatus Neomarinimicrobiota bacterium]